MRWFPDPPDGEKLLVKAVDDGPPEVLTPDAWGSHRSGMLKCTGGYKDIPMPDTEPTAEEIAKLEAEGKEALFAGILVGSEPTREDEADTRGDKAVARQRRGPVRGRQADGRRTAVGGRRKAR